MREYEFEVGRPIDASTVVSNKCYRIPCHRSWVGLGPPAREFTPASLSWSAAFKL